MTQTLTKQDLSAIKALITDALAGYASGAPKMLASRPDDGIGVDEWTPRPVCANEWDALDNAIHGYNPEGLQVRWPTSSYRLDEVGEGGLRHLTELSGNKVTVVVGSFDDAMHELDAAHCLPGDALDFDLDPSGLRPKPIGKRWVGAKDPYAVTFLMMAGIIKTAAQLDAEKGQFPGSGFGDSWAFDGQANGTQMARSFTLGEAWAAWQAFRAKTSGTPGAGPGGASYGPVGAGDGGGSKG